MLERHLTRLATDDPGAEDPASTRRRLRDVFSSGFGRRATVLGLLMGGVLRRTLDHGCDTIVHASGYGEVGALAGFLDSFPHPSPTLFQTSVHPSSVQQVMIDRRQSVREFVPLAGGPHLAGRALAVACLSPAESVVLCGGEERGTWMADLGMASARSFAFAMVLRTGPVESALARIRLEPRRGADGGEPPALAAFFDLLHLRRGYRGPMSGEWSLDLEWT